MIILDPDLDPTYQLISDPAPTCQLNTDSVPDPETESKKFHIRADADSQHWSSVCSTILMLCSGIRTYEFRIRIF